MRKGLNMKKSIRLDGVKKSFKGNVLFENVCLEIEKGQIVGFKGRNGSGKSVLLKIIAGLYTPDEGAVYIQGERLGDRIDYPENVGILVDSSGFIEVLSGYENLCLLAEIKQVIGRREIEEAMKKFNLDPYSRKKVKNYSLGMKEKLGIIQATMEGQEIVILDEPFSALDESSCQYLYQFIRQLRDEEKTILITSHNQTDLDELCDVQYRVPTFE